MAELKKNQLNQIMFVMVDATDFASIESTLGAASVAARFYGANHGGSAATTSGALSKACSLVHSGIFRQTIKATECNYDYVVYRFTATGCADQVMAFQTVTNDDSDIYSLMSDFVSDFQSRVPKLVATNSQLSDLHSDLRSYLVGCSAIMSDAHSAATLAASRALVCQSLISDVDSAITSRFLIYTSDISDIKSMLTYLSDLGSNAYSAAVVGASRALVCQSMISDVDSAITSRFLIYTSDISDIKSLLTYLSDLGSNAYSAAVVGASRALVCQSMISDVDSAITSRFLIYTSDISDIKSMLIYLSVLGSNAYSAAVVGASRALVCQSMISDVDSALTSRFSNLESVIATTGIRLTASDISDLRSAIAAGPAATITASDISDIASAVWANAIGSDVNSKIGKLASRITKKVATDSQISDFWSDLLSNFTTTADASDIASAIWAEHYQAQAGASTYGSIMRALFSNVSDIQSALDSQFLVTTSTLSDIDSALSSQFLRMSDYTSDIKSAITVVQSMASDAASAAQQGNSRALVIQSAVSDVDSALTSQLTLYLSDISDIRSMLTHLSDATSNAYSAAVVGASRALLNQSAISDLDSALTSRFSNLESLIGTTGVKISASDMSDLRSAVAALTLVLDASNLSDIASAVIAGINSGGGVALDASTLSDIRSAIALGPTATVTASDISDIASAVWAYANRTAAIDASNLSDLLSAINRGPTTYASDISDILSGLSALQAGTSDIRSQLDAGVVIAASDRSDLRSAIGAVQLSASDISDIASAVLYSTRFSNSVVVRIEDIWNALSDTDSAVSSQFSDLKSHLTVLQSTISDAHSMATKASSQLTVQQSTLSDIQSALAAVTLSDSALSDIRSAVTAATSDIKSMVSDVQSDLQVVRTAMANKQVIY